MGRGGTAGFGNFALRRQSVSRSFRLLISPPSFPPKVQLSEAERMNQETTASLFRSIRMAEQADAVGADTLVELDEQGRKIERVERQGEGIEDNLKQGRRHLRGLKSVFGSVANKFSKNKSYRFEGDERERNWKCISSRQLPHSFSLPFPREPSETEVEERRSVASKYRHGSAPPGTKKPRGKKVSHITNPPILQTPTPHPHPPKTTDGVDHFDSLYEGEQQVTGLRPFHWRVDCAHREISESSPLAEQETIISQMTFSEIWTDLTSSVCAPITLQSIPLTISLSC